MKSMELEEKYRALIREDKTGYDLLFLLTYMASVATADIERGLIFKYTAGQKEYSVSKYFKYVDILASKWGYEYTRACKLLSKKIKDARLSELLGRFATTLSSGEPEKEFLKKEMFTMAEVYTNEYERSIEELKKWTDGYTALLVATTLVVTIILISSMIYPVPNLNTIIILVLFLLIIVCSIGNFAIQSSAPDERKIHSLKKKSMEQRRVRVMEIFLIPFTLLFTLPLLYRHINPGYILMTMALFVFPVGIVGMIDDEKIDKRDMSFPAFIKTLGSLAGTMSITTRGAMEKLDKENVGFLEPLVEKLNWSLSLDLKPEICWERFIEDSGSELINRAIRIFNDAIELGGDPEEVAEIVSSSSLAIVLLRMKRRLVSSGFVGLITVLHLVMTGLLVFIVEIMRAFSNVMKEMYDAHISEIQEGMNGMSLGMGFFGLSENIDFLYWFTLASVLILTFSDAIVLKIAEGGGNYKYYYYGAIMFAVSGIVLIIVPFVVNRVFSFDI